MNSETEQPKCHECMSPATWVWPEDGRAVCACDRHAPEEGAVRVAAWAAPLPDLPDPATMTPDEVGDWVGRAMWAFPHHDERSDFMRRLGLRVKEFMPAEQNAADLLREVAVSGVEMDDPRLSYVVVQIDVGTWRDIRARYGQAADLGSEADGG